MRILLVLLATSLGIIECIAQNRDRSNMQYDVHVGDTIYKYSFFSQPSRWVGYIVMSKDDKNLITAKSFDGKDIIKPYQRIERGEYEPLDRRVYAGKEELKSLLGMVPEFSFKLTKVKKKRGNSILDVTKNANLNKCTYSDAFLNIVWTWGNNEYFGLNIRNKSQVNSIMLIWDDAIYVDMEGNSCTIRNTSNSRLEPHQPPTRILEDTKTSMAIIPTSCYTSTSESQITYGVKYDACKRNGNTIIRICLPIKINGVVSRYDFYFDILCISELEYLQRNGLIDI